MELKVGQKLKIKNENGNDFLHFYEKKMDCIKVIEDIDSTRYWDKTKLQIVFDTWKDVYNMMRDECVKYNSFCYIRCNGCELKKYTDNDFCCYTKPFRNKDYNKLAENFEKMFGMECYVLEKEKMNEEFTLEDIKDEMIIKLRNGTIYISLGQRFINEYGFMSKYKYFSNFKCRTNSNFDIVEIYDANKKYGYGFNGMLTINEDSELLWKEIEEPITKDVSLEEINSLLKEKYPYVEKFNLPIDNNK